MLIFSCALQFISIALAVVCIHRKILFISCNVSKWKHFEAIKSMRLKSKLIICSRNKLPVNGFSKKTKKEMGNEKEKKKNWAIHYYEYETISDDSDTCLDNNGCQGSSLTLPSLYSFINMFKWCVLNVLPHTYHTTKHWQPNKWRHLNTCQTQSVVQGNNVLFHLSLMSVVLWITLSYGTENVLFLKKIEETLSI